MQKCVDCGAFTDVVEGGFQCPACGLFFQRSAGNRIRISGNELRRIASKAMKTEEWRCPVQCKCGSDMAPIDQGVFLCHACGITREVKNNEWKENDLIARMDKRFKGFRDHVNTFFYLLRQSPF